MLVDLYCMPVLYTSVFPNNCLFLQVIESIFKQLSNEYLKICVSWEVTIIYAESEFVNIYIFTELQIRRVNKD